jgi:hypothetical protein
MSGIGSLELKVSMNVSQLISGVQSAAKTLDNSINSATKITPSLKNLLPPQLTTSRIASFFEIKELNSATSFST